MLTSKTKSFQPDGSEEGQTQDATSLKTASRTHYQLNYSGPLDMYRLAGLAVKASASGAEDLEFEFRLRRKFSGSSHTNDFFFF